MNKENPFTSGDCESGRAFLRKGVCVDPEIEPIFNEAVQNWDAH